MPDLAAPITIRTLSPEKVRERIPELSAVLLDCVHGGASVSFMAPMAPETADRFWQGVATRAANGDAVVLVAEQEGRIVGTAQLVTGLPENQPHRADVAKVLVHRGARNRGVAQGLMEAVEAEARRLDRTLLVLDTVPDTPAYRLYTRLGWQEVGRVPGFALWPDGRPCDTAFFFKTLR
ncbi:GNAT family N-acetyltransferase [Mesorhizobium sp. RP14(2022)]|uniref:GNAT family N-acetyltransferase n=1 Tax=Mesorhizobium liriopis TaxID=2953882 RepID=A0ABT1C9A1_9HYPH|nr:GNAT family N-acetyltransferase [Mesorhizobium liriopis]MCO6051385.1 GNAT family N-acetyltransferase [Mesorhizobium liriopis]